MTEYTDENVQHAHAAELRQASDEFMQRLDRLHELESRKRELPPDEPEFVRLAREIEDVSRALLYSGGKQVEIAEEIHHEQKTSAVKVDLPIRETPPKRDAVAILSEWRAAERRLAAAAPGSKDEGEARADSERLRDEYRRITAPIPDEPEG
jgi:hypothetical protein